MDKYEGLIIYYRPFILMYKVEKPMTQYAHKNFSNNIFCLEYFL